VILPIATGDMRANAADIYNQLIGNSVWSGVTECSLDYVIRELPERVEQVDYQIVELLI
jgi:hypothetical protein